MRALPIVMPGPWKLLSPNGLLYNVADQDALLRLATVEGLNPSNMSVLVNESTGNLTEGAEKSHEKQWVRRTASGWHLLEELQWVHDTASGRAIPLRGTLDDKFKLMRQHDPGSAQDV